MYFRLLQKNCYNATTCTIAAVIGNEMTKDNALVGDYSETGAQVASDAGVTFVELYHSMMKDEVCSNNDENKCMSL